MEATNIETAIDDDPTKIANIRTILYVEDNLDSLKLMQSIVGHIHNTNLIVAHNARLGIALAKQKKPDLILLDIKLPGMNGYEALGILQHMGNTQHIPVIALTSKSSAEEKQRGLAAGFDAYLTKPINVKELIQNITDIFGNLD